MTILAFLQNAWAHTERGAKLMKADRECWIWATANCHSGRRLKYLFGEDCFEENGIGFANTTPEVGVGSSTKLPPDKAHICYLLSMVEPTLVITFGGQAEGVLKELWGGNLLCLPHPASRTLTNALLDQAKAKIKSFSGRIALRQGKGFVSEEII